MKFKNATEYKNHYGTPVVSPMLAKNTAVTLENLIKKYGEEEGKLRWDEYRRKQAASNSYEYKKEKHGWDKERYDEFNKSRSVTLENLIKKHGEDKGAEKWDAYVERQRYTCSKEYFVNEYGNKAGKKKYENFCQQRIFIQGSMIISKVEQECYHRLNEHIEELEQQIFLPNPHFSSFDYGSINAKKLIEFYGTFWHCDPRIYEKSYVHDVRKITAGRIWHSDKAKQGYATNLGYSVCIIWENDWYADPIKVVEDTVKWWYNGN
jgi:hypothetical protein